MSPEPPPASARREVGLPRARVLLAPPEGSTVEVEVEVARTDSERRRGLMFRRSMPPDHGMLFVFDAMEHQSFWMRNTFLRLDIIFLDDRRTVVGIVEDATPLTLESRAVDADSQYVLEVHAGFARRHGLTPGTTAQFLDLPEDIDALH